MDRLRKLRNVGSGVYFGEFLWTRQAQAISASEAIPIERICFNGRRTGLGTRRVSPHMPARAIQAYLLHGASHRPAHQLLRSRNLGQRHSTTATRARQASTSAPIRLPPTVLSCPNASALQVLAADSARPPAQSPLGVALERTRVRTRSVTTTYSQSRLRPRQSSLRSSAVIPGPNSRSTALVAKNWGTRYRRRLLNPKQLRIMATVAVPTPTRSWRCSSCASNHAASPISRHTPATMPR